MGGALPGLPALPTAPSLGLLMAHEAGRVSIQALHHLVVSSGQRPSGPFAFAFSILAGQTHKGYFQKCLYGKL